MEPEEEDDYFQCDTFSIRIHFFKSNVAFDGRVTIMSTKVQMNANWR